MSGAHGFQCEHGAHSQAGSLAAGAARYITQRPAGLLAKGGSAAKHAKGCNYGSGGKRSNA